MGLFDALSACFGGLAADEDLRGPQPEAQVQSRVANDVSAAVRFGGPQVLQQMYLIRPSLIFSEEGLRHLAAAT